MTPMDPNGQGSQTPSTLNGASPGQVQAASDDATGNRRPRTVWLVLSLVWFLAIGFLALVLPASPGDLTPSAFLVLPLELPLAGLALLLLARPLGRLLAALVTVLVLVLLFLRLADLGVETAFQRPFNPYLDGKMIADGWNILSGSIGRIEAGGVVILAILALSLVILAFFKAQGILTGARDRTRRRLLTGFAGLAAAALLLMPFASSLPVRGQARAGSDLVARLSLVRQSVADLQAFEQELAKRPGPPNGQGLFSAIAGRDVLLVFVESYGRSALEDPRYAATMRPRLAAIDQTLTGHGFATATGFLQSPTVGGLSWLAHGTFLSGLWIDSQARYDRLVRSDQPSLNRLFSQAGWDSVAIVPAITRTWSEAGYFGYDRVFASQDLGYRGLPFNWVTMPDQYTLSAFERLARRPADGRPVMAEIVLITSHAPWTPVPVPVAWEAVGDGTIFSDQARAGDPPAVIWADPERVRRQYLATIDYSLTVLGDYIDRYGRDAVVIVLGDHQPAAIITGPNATRDVPVHIVTRDRSLVSRFQQSGFSPGLLPPPESRSRSMASMRDLLIQHFSAPGPSAQSKP